jgi:hypothetical protein
MAQHFTRARLARSVTGAASAMILSAVALFAVAHHLAG